MMISPGNPSSRLLNPLARRTFLRQGGAGIGGAVLAALFGRPSTAAADERWAGVVQPLHHPAKAKRVIYLCMAGGPSQLETFDPKPKLAELNGQPMPDSFTKGKPIAQLQGQKLVCLGPQHEFHKAGQSGQDISAIFPKLREVADDLCIVRSMVTEAINHDPAHTFMNTGTTISGRPSIGSWLTYGLGSDSDNLPGFVVLTSLGEYGAGQPVSQRQWHSGFLPTRFQGVQLRSQGEAVLFLDRPAGVNVDRQRDVVAAVRSLNELENGLSFDPEIATRIQAYETAFKMQTAVPELLDLSSEPKHVLERYGTQGADGTFASNCLLARRMAERGVRFIQLYHRDWDHHLKVKSNIQILAHDVDQATTALLMDLKERGMLDETLVIWGGEFGRTPMAQGDGRDHHIQGFSIWMAGGGIRGGMTYGATDELGYAAVEDIVHVNDFHATLLHLLGIDHKRLTYKFQGRDFRLTDVAGKVVDKVLA